MDHLYTSIQAYAAAYSAAEPPLLSKINQETHAEVPGARMLSGHLQGRALAMFSQMIRPSRVLELGTYTGYATLCLAEGLQEKGILYTIDRDKSLEERVRGYFEQAGIASQIRYYLGEALDIIPQLDEVFDLVFIDADKRNYSLYYELLLEKVRLGGFIIVDNVLWNGKVLADVGVAMDKQTKAISDFNKQVNEDRRVEQVLLPIRDGLMILRKRC
jgi:predicted O-methyltransferase YrrM